MKPLIFIFTITLFSCGQFSQKPVHKKESSEIEKSKLSVINEEIKDSARAEQKGNVEPEKLNNLIIGEKIQGDFNGDGHTEFAAAIKIKEGEGNPIDSGIPAEYEIQFSTDKLPPLKAGCCNIRLINEGDLNNDGTDEISLFQAPMNGCTYSMTTYSFVNEKWNQTVKTFLIPTGCDILSNEDLQKRVFKEDNAIYYYDIDPNDEKGKLIKTKAKAE